MKSDAGTKLREKIQSEDIVPLVGAYDVFSASIAAKYFDGIFISGFSFAASYYGLPDIGFISWSDIVAFTHRVRTILPHHHIMVDIDDGYCDPDVACHVVSLLEKIGASGVVLEDQKRPRRCGHFDGKQILELEPFLEKLNKVIEQRDDLYVVARTDAVNKEEAFSRAIAFAELGADAVLVEAVDDLDFIVDLKSETNCTIVFNQIAGGKSPHFSLRQLKEAGVSLVHYSSPCLFAAQSGLEDSMKTLLENDGLLPDSREGAVDIKACTQLLTENLTRRDER